MNEFSGRPSSMKATASAPNPTTSRNCARVTAGKAPLKEAAQATSPGARHPGCFPWTCSTWIGLATLTEGVAGRGTRAPASELGMQAFPRRRLS
jgi:hypothetical protein